MKRRTFVKAGTMVTGVIGASPILNACFGWHSKSLFLLGSYAESDMPGLSLCSFDPSSGEIFRLDEFSGLANPSFLVSKRDRKTVFAVLETDRMDDKSGGGVVSLDLMAEGPKIKQLSVVSSGGLHPCHLALDQREHFLAIANYSSGSVAMCRVAADGSITPPYQVSQHQGNGPVISRQAGPHAHCVVFSSDNRYLYACDLGADAIFVYRFNSDTGEIILDEEASFRSRPGSGPRHFILAASGEEAFVINELNSTVVRFKVDPVNGSLHPLQEFSTLLPGEAKENFPADIHLHPSSLFLYGSNRGDNSIVLYSRSKPGEDFILTDTFPCKGDWPRNFAIDPSGNFLLVANQRSDSLTVFEIDQKNGRLLAVDQRLHAISPVCIRFV